MRLRKYTSADCTELAELFYNTVHTVNARDYTQSQLDVWADGSVDISAWNKSFLEHNTIVAEIENVIAGFGDMDNSGYLDRLYVHRNYQNKGVAAAIVNELEEHALSQGIATFTTHASITAKAFFERHGYCIVRENKVIRSGVALTNFVMKKEIIK